MKTKKEIGWQKYEEVIKEQINSPVLKEILEEIKINTSVMSDMDSDEEEMEYEDEDGEAEHRLLISIPETIINEAAMTTHFDCWIGHCNFNLTDDIKDEMDKIEGIEVLKICSRYRFFIGIGKMFDFKNVRQDIENIIL